MPDLPSATTTLSSIKEWSNPMFQSLLPYAYLAMGILVGIGLILFLVYLGSLVLHHLRGQ